MKKMGRLLETSTEEFDCNKLHEAKMYQELWSAKRYLPGYFSCEEVIVFRSVPLGIPEKRLHAIRLSHTN